MNRLKVPYILPYFRALSCGTTVEQEEEIDRSAPPEYWEAALNSRDLENIYRKGKLPEVLPWLKGKT